MTAVTPSGRFVLRTPLLPAATLGTLLDGLVSTPDRYDDDTIAADLATLSSRVRDLIADAAVREALFVASPTLVGALDRWVAGEPSDPVALLRSTLSYVTRMCLRATPFGLFAGCSVGAVGDGALSLAPRHAYRRATRLDYGFLARVVHGVESDRTARGGLTFFPNSGIYRAGGRLRFAERRVEGGSVRYHRVAVREDEALTTVLDAATGGATLDGLAKTLVGDGITVEDARAYVEDLVDAQLLVSDLGPPITGNDAGSELVVRLAAHDGTRAVADALATAIAAMRALDADGAGADVAGYAAVADAARTIDPSVDESRLVQVDMFKPGDDLVLPAAVARELARAVEVLHRIQPDSEDEVASFRKAFEKRYEDREVPLGVALDEEVGIGFGGSSGVAVEGAPLLAGLRASTPGETASTWRARDAYLLGLLERARGATELRLTDADVRALSSERPLPLPRALAATATVAGTSATAVASGEFSLLFRGAMGPSGAQLLGRFSHLDPSVEAMVRDHVEAEEGAEPDAAFAEIVHLPEGRLGNILARPVLRAYEIPFVGASGAPAEGQVPLDDLYVSVRGGRVVLRSARLGREVLPRLTSAHSYRRAALAVYRFLAAVQFQRQAWAVGWTWGPLESVRFLPRVVLGRVVLERARWLVAPSEQGELAEAATPLARYAAAQRLRAVRGLPRHVVIAEGDNELAVDLDTVAGTELLAHAARRRGSMRLVERFPGSDEHCVQGPEGAYANEIVLPMLADSAPVARPLPRVVEPSVDGFRDTFAPGSEWLYAKLYTGRLTTDAVLRGVVAPLVAEARASGACDGWFFLRYQDPDQHVRVRLHGDVARLLPLLDRHATPFVDDGTVERVQLDTYRREVARYGGPDGVVLSERLFEADSVAALAALRSLNGDAAAEDRWRIALAGLDRLYDDLGVGLDLRRAVVRGWRDDLVAEYGETGVAAKRLSGRLFRTERPVLASLIAGEAASPTLRAGLGALDARGEAVREVAGGLRALDRAGRLSVPVERLAVSYGHMWVIRMMRGVPRLQELTFCDLLDRLYAARLAT
jgi:thiopeptide-type bacteriocin biosynthesis protein